MSSDKKDLDQLRIDRDQEDGDESRKWTWLIIALILLAGLALGWWFLHTRAAEVRTFTARANTPEGFKTVLNASGYVTARRRATVSSKVTAKVVEVLLEEGMKVDEGQVLARLDASNVQTSLRVAEAQLLSAKAALVETKARLDVAQAERRRVADLETNHIASPSDLDKAVGDAESLKAHLEQQQADAVVAERQVALWQQQMEDTIIKAPFTGIVVTKDAQPGEMISPVSAGGGFTRTGIGTIVDMASLEIEVDVNESHINRVKAAQPVLATLDAYPEWKIPCKVIAIIPTADRQKATVKVRIGFDALDQRILPDMGVKVAFRESGLATATPGVLIPKSAVRLQDGQRYVMLVKEGRAERRKVTVGDLNGDEIVVLSGLAAGEKVVAKGPDNLAEGGRVKEASQ